MVKKSLFPQKSVCTVFIYSLAYNSTGNDHFFNYKAHKKKFRLISDSWCVFVKYGSKIGV